MANTTNGAPPATVALNHKIKRINPNGTGSSSNALDGVVTLKISVEPMQV